MSQKPPIYHINRYRGFEGTDADLETSLYEYGLIWKKAPRENPKDYKFIYGVYHNDEEYELFDYAFLPINTDPKEEWNWAEWDSFLSFVGMTEEAFFKMPLPFIVSDLIAYYGHENVFGGCYYPFAIKGKE